jgi:1-deoxy-D-xylulose-5-phosphate synthase
MAHGASLSGLRPHVPNQFADTGIGEASAITMAAGLAAAGDTPIVYIYSTFLHRAVDQLIHDVGCQALPVVLVVDRAQLAGEDGPTHHGIYDLAILATVPGMQVYGVTTASDLEAVLRAAVENRQGPMAIRIFKGQEIEPSEDVIRQCPEFRVRREGADVTIVAHGRIVSEALDASAILRHESISARVVEVIKLNPLSDQLLHTMTDWRGAVLVVEEVIPSGSIGIQLCGALARQAIEVQHLCVRDPLISHNSRSRQLDELSLSASKIADVAKRLFTRCGKR